MSPSDGEMDGLLRGWEGATNQGTEARRTLEPNGKEADGGTLHGGGQRDGRTEQVSKRAKSHGRRPPAARFSIFHLRWRSRPLDIGWSLDIGWPSTTPKRPHQSLTGKAGPRRSWLPVKYRAPSSVAPASAVIRWTLVGRGCHLGCSPYPVILTPPLPFGLTITTHHHHSPPGGLSSPLSLLPSPSRPPPVPLLPPHPLLESQHTDRRVPPPVPHISPTTIHQPAPHTGSTCSTTPAFGRVHTSTYEYMSPTTHTATTFVSALHATLHPVPLGLPGRAVLLAHAASPCADPKTRLTSDADIPT